MPKKKNHKNLAVGTPQDFESMVGHLTTFWMKNFTTYVTIT